MPPAVIAGAATLGGALIQSHSAGSANKAQQHANDQALAYQREQDAAAQKRYDQKYAQYQQDLQQYNATRKAILAHYGYNIPDAAPAGAPGGAPGVSTGAAAANPGLSLGGLMRGAPAGGRIGVARLSMAPGPLQGGPAQPPAPGPAVAGDPEGAPAPGIDATLAQLGGWNKWRNNAAS